MILFAYKTQIWTCEFHEAIYRYGVIPEGASGFFMSIPNGLITHSVGIRGNDWCYGR